MSTTYVVIMPQVPVSLVFLVRFLSPMGSASVKYTACRPAYRLTPPGKRPPDLISLFFVVPDVAQEPSHILFDFCGCMMLAEWLNFSAP